MSQDRKFEEQDHPLKNTDQAFVQVGKNGEPVIPQQNERSRQDDEKKDGEEQQVIYDKP